MLSIPDLIQRKFAENNLFLSNTRGVFYTDSSYFFHPSHAYPHLLFHKLNQNFRFGINLMQEIIISFINRFGYFGIFLLITLENLFPPIPSEVILTLGGFMTTYSSMNVPGVILFSTFGSLLGAIILYYVGRLLNQERLIALSMGPLGRILHFKTTDICRSISRFREKGNATVLYCRFIPILRSLISIPAGMCEMPQGRFLLYTTIGSLIWNTILVTLGSIVGDNWTQISDIFHKYSIFTKFVLLSVLVIFAFRHFRKK